MHVERFFLECFWVRERRKELERAGLRETGGEEGGREGGKAAVERGGGKEGG